MRVISTLMCRWNSSIVCGVVCGWCKLLKKKSNQSDSLPLSLCLVLHLGSGVKKSQVQGDWMCGGS